MRPGPETDGPNRGSGPLPAARFIASTKNNRERARFAGDRGSRSAGCLQRQSYISATKANMLAVPLDVILTIVLLPASAWLARQAQIVWHNERRENAAVTHSFGDLLMAEAKIHCDNCGADVSASSFRMVARCPHCDAILHGPFLDSLRPSPAVPSGPHKPARFESALGPLRRVGTLVVLLESGVALVLLRGGDRAALEAALSVPGWLIMGTGVALLLLAAVVAGLLVQRLRKAGPASMQPLVTGLWLLAAGTASGLLGTWRPEDPQVPWRGKPSPFLVAGIALLLGAVAALVAAAYRIGARARRGDGGVGPRPRR
jgi:hypothetical protein